MKEEIQRVKEQEEQAMREALGNRLDKQEFTELVKRGSTAEDLAMQIYLLTCLSATLYRAPRPWEDPITLTSSDAVPARLPADTSRTKPVQFGPDETERNQIKDRHEERKPARREKEERHEKRNKHERREKRKRHDEKRHARDIDEWKKHKKDKKDSRKRWHDDSDSD
ncbi:hypothetical protein Bca4012_031933 [Brassica carinata]|uniref:Uncharacterized protein n=1 Tax=Brassica carinata TaxID=52824 RepID=A0A8X7USP4_BRACI|nr:hypothetical protein Bca52824_046740 [Brassica carinata]